MNRYALWCPACTPRKPVYVQTFDPYNRLLEELGIGLVKQYDHGKKVSIVGPFADAMSLCYALLAVCTCQAVRLRCPFRYYDRLLADDSYYTSELRWAISLRLALRAYSGF
jgi:hypothetical protein